MIEIVIAIAIVILLVVFLTVRKKKTEARAVFAPAPATPVKTETVVEVKATQQVVVEPVAAAKTDSAVTVEKTLANPLLPQDSVLKRHYVHHIHEMLIELHYEGDIVAKVAECVASEVALQHLIQAYETKPVVEQVAQTLESVAVEVLAEPAPVLVSDKVTRIPEDSLLRRHYLTQIHALAAAKLPARPSDSTLCRHYDALLAQEVKKQLAAG